jgi:hypothetical protein
MLDEDYQRSLHEIGRLKERELLEQRGSDDGKVVRRIRCVLDIDLPMTARKFMGDGDPAWVELSVWHPNDLHWDFLIEPEVAGDLLDAKGTIGIEPDPAGTLRTIRGTVKIRIPFYGGRVESWIVQGLTDAYDEEAMRLESWLES